MGNMQSPFLIVNPKSYLYGNESLKLAKAADQAAKIPDCRLSLLVHMQM